MRVAHVIKSISRESGGTSKYMVDLLNGLVNKTYNTLVCFKHQDDLNCPKRLKVKTVSRTKEGFMGYSKAFNEIFKKTSTYLFHGNGVWDMPIHQMAIISKKRNIPYVISPHGMLEPWSLSQGKLKKIIARKLLIDKTLHNAACIHATAISEAQNIRALGFNNPIAVIPNGINFEEFPTYKKKSKSKKKLLFLSRIHEKKGIELIIKSWSELDSSLTKDWKVEIVGNGDTKYIKELQQIICNLELEQLITIFGPLFGEAKQLKFREADLFVLPTYSENFGIVIAEALASMVPVITTKGTPWEELNINNCGDWIDIGLEPLKASLSKMLIKTDDELLEMGKRGRQLIENKYSMEAVSRDMLSLYNWLIYNNQKPKFII